MTDNITELAAEKAKRQGQLPEHADDRMAYAFTTANAGILRYVARQGAWYVWDGTRWAEDTTLDVFDRVRAFCREVASRADPRIRVRLASRAKAGAVHGFATVDQRTAATIELWDADPWLLSTPAGVVDLRTGETRPARAEDFMTKLTSVAPAEGCPLFLKFLDEITEGSCALQGFLQRMAGYALTGITRDHALFFLYGTGANGKSVFLNALVGILGDYHRVAPIEMLLASKQDRHPTELAGLVGRRLVSAIETEKSRRWAEAKIKSLTGGDMVTARFMCRDFFDFTPRFKIIVVGNTKPALNTVDEAMERRFHLVPFTVTIPAEKRDLELGEKLKAEWPGILHWAIEGCLEWQKIGLAPPKAVTEATSEYLNAQDTVTNWLTECTEADPLAETSTSALYKAWGEWCEANGERPGTSKAFSQALLDRGYTINHTRKGNMVRGLRIAAS